jgi:glycosyltransferase involved in cell wall biosynthesis
MKVVYITPTYFDEKSMIGGGERYPTELAAWMSKMVDTTLVSFSDQRDSYQKDNLKFEIYPVSHLINGSKINPLSFLYLREVIAADVIHIHHISTLVSDMGCLAAALLGNKVFATDHGGGAGCVLNSKIPVFWGYKNVIAQSKFVIDFIPKKLQKKAVLIKGGIDTDKFCPDRENQKENTILYVGRILPHKGINYLIDAFRLLDRPDYKLKIVGRVYNDRFYQKLKEMAQDLSIEFIHDADDLQLLQEYQQAKVTVLPSVHTSLYGDYTPVPELMGFTLLESQACGTPAICTDAGAMHEFVDNGNTGYVVKQNSGEVIATALTHIINLSLEEYLLLGTRCRSWIETLSWQAVVKQHLDIYSEQSN